MGGGTPKALMRAGGRTLLERCLETLSMAVPGGPVVVACPAGMTVEFREAAGAAGCFASFVDGGEERSDSVEAAFRAMPPEPRIIAVHDAARPFATPELFFRVSEAAARYGAAVPAIPVQDTVKIVGGGVALETPPRPLLHAVQTPQCFHHGLFAASIEEWARSGRPPVTDDAMLVERLGAAVAVVEGERGNVKITFPGDLKMAEKGEGGDFRVGQGYDLHRIAEGRQLVLGGARFDCGFGLLGHSDADVLTHAVIDAILGAAGLPDIGRLYPDSDPEYKGADSLELLRDAAARVAAAGYRVVNIDCTVVAERPKIAPVAEEICSRLAAGIGTPGVCVNVKGKTNEKLGPEGRGEAISAQAVALLAKTA
jgi:2-C-methyl-D-erythritol 4-phosphate cytidylyltransferase/2-C-methyl-D-erythritol 2,4-cyclodiphosphate synthase